MVKYLGILLAGLLFCVAWRDSGLINAVRTGSPREVQNEYLAMAIRD
jgi:hypothetical protein